MQSLLCATGNDHKFGLGATIFKKYDIVLEQVVIDIDEIQGEDPEVIIRDKALKAFEAIGKPVIVTDDSWDIVGLNGFPGAYMKSMNHWLQPGDFIRLTSHLKDRTIILHQFVAYQDAYETVIFSSDIRGELATEPHGNFGPPCMKVVQLDSDGGQTISETYDANKAHDPERLLKRADSWQELAKWYKAKITEG